MPVKDTAPFLKECIDSIISQSYSNWELLAINDHSSDDSLTILEAYAKNDQRIKVYNNSGKGIVDALQMAYKHAKGDYITRMDSDDINALDKYETMQEQLLKAGKGSLALGQVKYFSANGVGDGYQKYEAWLNGPIEQGNCFSEVYKECVIPSPCWMLHKEDLEQIGGISTDLIPEDYDLCFRMYKAGLTCIPSSKVLLHWRDSLNRTSRTNDDYTEDTMLTLKCHYFLEIDYNNDKSLVLWGAGKRGKSIAKYLIERDISFTWVCNNEKKIGHDIYGVILRSVNELIEINDKQIIVTVANSEERKVIRTQCQVEEWETYFFC